VPLAHADPRREGGGGNVAVEMDRDVIDDAADQVTFG
jgi:hypothetical protein